MVLSNRVRQNNGLKLINCHWLVLLHTRSKNPNPKKNLKSMFPNWHSVNNFAQVPIWRILVCWDPLALSLQVLSQTSQYIHCDVQACDGSFQFYTTFVYGSNNYIERQELWSHSHQMQSSSPWVVMGDFNAIKTPSEKVGGDRSWPPWMDDFGNCPISAELEDLRYSGCQFTWSNGQEGKAFVSI